MSGEVFYGLMVRWLEGSRTAKGVVGRLEVFTNFRTARPSMDSVPRAYFIDLSIRPAIKWSTPLPLMVTVTDTIYQGGEMEIISYRRHLARCCDNKMVKSQKN